MTSRSNLLIRVANAFAVCLCIAWFVFDPGFEPVVTGFVVAAGFLVPLEGTATKGQVAPPLALDEPEKPPHEPVPSAFPLPAELPPVVGGHQHSITVHRGDLLVLKGTRGIAVVEIKALKGSRAKYRWRFAPPQGGPEESGSGEVYEQYARVQRDASMVTDVGGELLIKAGPYKIEWSQGGLAHGYVYPRGTEYSAYVVTDTSLRAFRL